MGLHRCTHAECPFEGQQTSRSCGCHKTNEQVLEKQRDDLLATLRALCDDIEKHHAPDDCDTCRLVDKACDLIAKVGGRS